MYGMPCGRILSEHEIRVVKISSGTESECSGNVVVNMISFETPTSGQVGVYYPASFSGHLAAIDNVHRPAVGLCYHNGPADHVYIKAGQQEFTVEKGECVAGLYPVNTPTCSTLSRIYDIKYPVAGTYTIFAGGGYVTPDDRVLCLTSQIVRTVNISQAQPPPTPTPTPTPTPPSPPGPFGIPLWIWIIVAMLFMMFMMLMFAVLATR